MEGKHMDRTNLPGKLVRRQRGMTLIEIMVVIAILGMMGTLITVYFVRQQEQAKVDGTNIEMNNVKQALDLFKIKFGAYPSTEESLQVLVNKELMEKLPKDMWGSEFHYVRHNSRSYTLKSFGADGEPGGEGVDKDLVLEH